VRSLMINVLTLVARTCDVTVVKGWHSLVWSHPSVWCGSTCVISNEQPE
jgi:hypothetical protein